MLCEGFCWARSGPVRGEPSVKRDSRQGRVLGVMAAIEGVGVGDVILLVMGSGQHVGG